MSKPLYEVGDAVLAKHTFYLIADTPQCKVLSRQRKLFGWYYILSASVHWIDGGYTQKDTFGKYQWQIKGKIR